MLVVPLRQMVDGRPSGCLLGHVFVCVCVCARFGEMTNERDAWSCEL